MKLLLCCLLFVILCGHVSVVHADGLVEPSAEELAKIQATAAGLTGVPPKAPRKVLVCSIVPSGYIHSAIRFGEEALKAIAAETGAFEVVVSNDMSYFEPEKLKQFDVVFFNNANNELFLPANFQQLAGKEKVKAMAYDKMLKASLVDFIKSGKGVCMLHASLAIFREWDEYGNIIGGRFDNHPWNKEVTLTIEDPSHPLNAAFGGKESIKLADEIYQVKGPYSRDTHRILVSLDLEATGEPNVKATINREDKDLALAWIKPYGEGRVFYCGFGHFHELFWNPVIQQFILDGTQFAAGDVDADMTPSAKLK